MIPIGILTAAATSSFSFLLNLYPGAAAAYSLRKLRSAYSGNCIRVLNSSTSVQMDIGFVNNVLDVTTLQTFIGLNTGTVTVWYDQSGNSNNATGDARIIISGVLQTLNSLPTLNFLGSGQTLAFTTNIAASNNISVFITQKTALSTDWGAMLGHAGALGPSGPFWGITNGNKYNTNITISGVSKNGASTTNAGTNTSIINGIVNATNSYPYINNTLVSITLSNWSPNNINFSNIGRYNTVFSNSLMSEVVIYKSDETSNRTGIINNTNTFYTIF